MYKSRLRVRGIYATPLIKPLQRRYHPGAIRGIKNLQLVSEDVNRAKACPRTCGG